MTNFTKQPGVSVCVCVWLSTKAFPQAKCIKQASLKTEYRRKYLLRWGPRPIVQRIRLRSRCRTSASVCILSVQPTIRVRSCRRMSKTITTPLVKGDQDNRLLSLDRNKQQSSFQWVTLTQKCISCKYILWRTKSFWIFCMYPTL